MGWFAMPMRIAPREPEDWNKPIETFPLLRPKMVAIGLAVLAGLLVVAAGLRMIPQSATDTREAAGQVKACKAYLQSEPRLTAALCNPGNWRQGDALDGNQATLP